MPNEQSKAAKRRFNIGAFHSRYFVGDGIDVGGKPDPLDNYSGIFAKMRSCRTWDLEDGDAMLLEGVPDNSYDFLHSSHCLEHMEDVKVGLFNWIRVVKPGGHLIISVPDEDMYEKGEWPSKFNPDHKWTFTVCKRKSWSPKSINIVDLVKEFCDIARTESIQVQRDFFMDWIKEKKFDQTQMPPVECCIEFILMKL